MKCISQMLVKDTLWSFAMHHQRGLSFPKNVTFLNSGTLTLCTKFGSRGPDHQMQILNQKFEGRFCG